MIRKWIRHATTRALPAAAELGYVSELARHETRHRRHASAWRPHLENSRGFIARFLPRTPGRDLAVVAGSGLCLDVPLLELSDAFKTVVLVDVVHPREVKRLAARLGNVILLTADLTGVLEATAAILRSGTPSPLPSCEPAINLPAAPDLVVSANTLSQLPLLPLERLWATGFYKDAELEAFALSILRAHLAWLNSFPSVRCLITDVAWLGRENQEIVSADPLHGLSLPAPEARWEWMHAPKPEAHPRRDIVHVVAGFSFSG